jgi:hypothetical protein
MLLRMLYLGWPVMMSWDTEWLLLKRFWDLSWAR